jgi:hypothetical protein
MKKRNAILAACTLALAACGGQVAEPDVSKPEFRALPGLNNWAMIIPAEIPSDEWRAAAREKCGSADFCGVYGWNNPTDAAQSLPMTDVEVASQIFSYSVNRTTGYEQALFDCTRVERKNRDECGAFGGAA